MRRLSGPEDGQREQRQYSNEQYLHTHVYPPCYCTGFFKP
jgi:hypothetical protein